jgi:hypothetical protein
MAGTGTKASLIAPGKKSRKAEGNCKTQGDKMHTSQDPSSWINTEHGATARATAKP